MAALRQYRRGFPFPSLKKARLTLLSMGLCSLALAAALTGWGWSSKNDKLLRVGAVYVPLGIAFLGGRGILGWLKQARKRRVRRQRARSNDLLRPPLCP
jgi:fatty acid desaturase